MVATYTGIKTQESDFGSSASISCHSVLLGCHDALGVWYCLERRWGLRKSTCLRRSLPSVSSVSLLVRKNEVNP